MESSEQQETVQTENVDEQVTIVDDMSESTDEVEDNSHELDTAESDGETPADDDMVTKAMRENEELKRQLEELRNSNENVFEQNEALKAELESQEKLARVAKENAELQQQLEGIKRRSIIDSLIAGGSLNNDLRGWAEALPFDSLQKFAEHAPRGKTILQQENSGISEAALEMQEWKKEQQRSRIL